jgi:hypothetical protein
MIAAATSAPKRPWLVEFIGVTGVGKSTLVTAVREELSALGCSVGEADTALLESCGLGRVRTPGLRSLLVSLFTFAPFLQQAVTPRGSRLTRMGLGLIARDGGSVANAARLLRNFVKRLGVHECLATRPERLKKYDFLLLDEGIIHTVHNLFAHMRAVPDAEELRRFVALLPRPDLLIWVKAPREQSLACVARRGHARVAGTGEDARLFIDHAHTAFETLAALNPMPGRFYTIDNTIHEGEPGSIRARARTVCDLLAGALRLPAGSEHPDPIPLPLREACPS